MLKQTTDAILAHYGGEIGKMPHDVLLLYSKNLGIVQTATEERAKRALEENTKKGKSAKKAKAASSVSLDKENTEPVEPPVDSRSSEYIKASKDWLMKTLLQHLLTF